MFTGLIEEIGVIENFSPPVLKIRAGLILEGMKIGDSVSVNGICLTVVSFSDSFFTVEVSSETQRCWAGENYRVSSLVNLERALRLMDRMGGHYVQGHVDGVGLIESFEKRGEFYRLEISFDPSLEPLIVSKGSVALDGISLTVNAVQKDRMELMIVPHTLSKTNLSAKKPGSRVNMETDILGRYAARILSLKEEEIAAKNSLSLESLIQNGFA